MARNGSGTYSRPVANYTYDTVISETDVNTEMDDIATALTASIAKDGQTVPTANLPMGTYRHTGVGNGSARTDYAALGQVQDSTVSWLGTSAGTNTATASASPAITAYAAGQRFAFLAGGTNTGATTINVNSVGAKAIQKNGAALVAGDITANDVVVVVYDGTQFQMVSPARTPVLTAGGISGTGVAAASDTARGTVELATTAETTTGTDATRAVTPDSLHDMTSLAGAAWFLDEDTMVSNSATQTASQQSIKAYVDATASSVTAGTPLQTANLATAATTQAHGLSAKPTFLTYEIECLTAEHNYSIGNRVRVTPDRQTSGSGMAWTVYDDATNVVALLNGGTVNIADKTTRANANLTNANWKLIVTPYLVS